MTNEKGSKRALRAALLGAVAVAVIIAACSEGTGNDLAGPKPNGGKLFAEWKGAAPRVQSQLQVYYEYQVEQPVTPAPGGASPVYPASMKSAGVEGQVLASFTVDTTGLANVGSLKIIKSTDSSFTNAVAAALPNMRFNPALVGGQKVRQLVQQPFMFKISGGTSAQRIPGTLVPR